MDETLGALRANDQRAWRLLHEREFPFLYRFALGMGAGSELAEDCASEAFVRLVRDFRRLKLEGPTSIRAWLIVVCRNYLRDQFRKQRGGPLPLADADGASTDVDTLTRVALASALATLPDAQREVIVMRFVLGMPSKEIATASGRGVKAVESLQHRGLEALRRSSALGAGEA